MEGKVPQVTRDGNIDNEKGKHRKINTRPDGGKSTSNAGIP